MSKNLHEIENEIDQLIIESYKHYRKIGLLEFKRNVSIDELANRYYIESGLDVHSFKEFLKRGSELNGEFN